MKKIIVLSFFIYTNLLASQKCQVEIFGTDTMRYTDSSGNPVSQIEVPADCESYQIIFQYQKDGKLPRTVMGHNFILVETKDLNLISSEALKAGNKSGYIPTQHKNKIIASSTKLLGGGKNDPKKETIQIPMKKIKKGGDYTFFCSFPGHVGMMRGKFVVLPQKKKKTTEVKQVKKLDPKKL